MSSHNRSLRLVALFEAAKGALVLLAGFGALSLLHRDTRQLAEQLITHLHLNAARHYPTIFIDAASRLTNSRLWMLAALAAAYGAVRLIEAYGLWHQRRWAEWFAAASGGIYLPIECYELVHRPGWIAAGSLTVNLFIVLVMLRSLRAGKR